MSAATIAPNLTDPTGGAEPPPLPAPDSLYYDWLVKMSDNQIMECDLAEDREDRELFGEDRELFNFTVKKVGANSWVGVPETIGMVSTKVLFDHVKEHCDGDQFIIVSYGNDPRRVKKEMVEAGVEPEGPKFFSVSSVIDLTESDEEETVIEEAATLGRWAFENVRAARSPCALLFCCVRTRMNAG